jgi:hypothetical protein
MAFDKLANVPKRFECENLRNDNRPWQRLQPVRRGWFCGHGRTAAATNFVTRALSLFRRGIVIRALGAFGIVPVLRDCAQD